MLVARLVDQPEFFESLVAIARVERLEQVEEPEFLACDPVPKLLISGAPKIPGVAAFDFVLLEHNSAIHVLENVDRQLRKIGRRFAIVRCFVFRDRLFFVAARDEKEHQRQGARPPRGAAEGSSCDFVAGKRASDDLGNWPLLLSIGGRA